MAEDDGSDSVDKNEDDDKDDQQPERSFSPADVERIVKDRLARAKSTPPDDYHDLKTKAAEFDKLQEANKTELERERERATKAEQDAAAATERANRRLIEAAVLTQATTQKALKPEHMHKLIDTEAVTVGDDGQVTGAEEAVKAFLEANPEYVGTGRASGSADQGARDRGGVKQLTRDDLASMSPEQVKQADIEGRLANLVGTPS